MKALLYRNIVILVYVLLLPLVGFAQRAGDLDRSFNYGRSENYGFNYGSEREDLDGTPNIVQTAFLQTNGKVIIGGRFNLFNGIGINGRARLNLDGSIDMSSLHPDDGSLSGQILTVNTSVVLPDGKFIVGGTTIDAYGTTRNYVGRMTENNYLDNRFNHGSGINDLVKSIAVQNDGKIIVVGAFTTYNGIAKNRIVRLNSNGSLDTNFNPGTGANSQIMATAVQVDGKIIIGGAFTYFNGIPRYHIARLNADGSLDNTFNPGTGSNYEINWITLQNDGKIIISGWFTSFNGTSRNRIARLNLNGSLDATFNPGLGAENLVYTSTVQADGKIIIGGDFTSYNGIGRNCIARINSNGSLDNTFNPGTGASSRVQCIALQNDNKIIIGGYFSTFNDIGKRRIARLNTDGSLDDSYNLRIGANGDIYTSVLQDDGKIIIGGNFLSYNGIYKNRIARLNANGSLDASFNSQIGILIESGSVFTTALQSDGKIIIGGYFPDFNNNGPTRYLARMNSNGTRDFSFNANPSNIVRAIAFQADGKIIIGGNFINVGGYTAVSGYDMKRITRLNIDGNIDRSFTPETTTDFNATEVSSIIIQPDGKIIVGGNLSTWNNFVTKYGITRLNANGSLDTSFNFRAIGIEGIYRNVTSIGLQADGKIILGGTFTSYNGINRNRIARLNTDGSLDSSFNPGSGVNGTIYTIAFQSNGKIIIGGDFTSYNGTIINRIARLNIDGSLDTTFIGLGARNKVRSLALQPDGKIISAGVFTTYNGLTTPRIVRIHGNDCPTPISITVSGIESFCNGESTILTSSLISGNLWSTGDTTRSIIVSTAGDYTVRSTNNGCTTAYSGIIRVTNLSTFVSVITGSTVICSGNTSRITSSSPTGNLWSTGDTTQSINVAQAGNYTVRKISNGCTSAVSDTFRVILNSITTPTISGDTTLCNVNTTTRLTSSSPTGNLWSTGDTTQFINVAQAGSYSVRVINSGCTSAASAPFRVVNAGPSPTVINFDTTSNRCLGARLQLTPAGTFAHYQWNTGERTRSIYTRTSGQYSVQVANSDSCFGLPSPPIFITFDTNWCSVEIFRVGIDSITANVWADYYIWYLDGIELLSSNTLKTIPIQGDGVYTFRAVTAGRTSPLSNPIVITSSKKSLVTKFEVYPNPATNKVTVNTSGTGTLEILNALGQVVITQPATTSNELNISHLAKGVYTVRFNGASKMLVVK